MSKAETYQTPEQKARVNLTDLDNLPEPDDLAEEIIENLEAGLNSFREVLQRPKVKLRARRKIVGIGESDC